jgi:hypothetical protein
VLLVPVYADSLKGAHYYSWEGHQALDEALLPMTASNATETWAVVACIPIHSNEMNDCDMWQCIKFMACITKAALNNCLYEESLDGSCFCSCVTFVELRG